MQDIFSRVQCVYCSRMRAFYHVHAVALVLCLGAAVSELYTGDKCYHKGKTQDGVCKSLTDCQSAMLDLRKKIYPENCGFEGSKVIVCCVEVKQPTSTTEPPTTTTVTVVPIKDNATSASTEVAPGTISRRKCKEYEELSYEVELSPILIDIDHMDKNGICPWDVIPAISGGTKAKRGEFPHMALLKYKKKQRCGGTLISDKFVLTAGHCIDVERGIVPVSVRLGDLDITDPNDDNNVQEISVKKVYVHPNFKQPVVYNDIALIELEKPAVLSVSLKPACLYTDRNLRFTRAIATGWGRTEEHVSSDHLLKATLDIFPTQSCNEKFQSLQAAFPNGVDAETQLCAGSFLSNKDTCAGDSGGPLQIYSTDVYCSHYVVAVTSLGLKCGVANSPALYTQVYPYLDWIESIVWPR